jgi:uncharacterized RDD family membrane protein YckC
VRPANDAWSGSAIDRHSGGSVRWRRPAARILDMTILVGPVVWVFWRLAGPPSTGPDDYRLMFQILAGIASFVWLVLGWPLYEVLGLAIYGRTLGKWITGVCVVSTDVDRLPTGRLIGRTLLLVASFVVTFLIALRLWFVYPPLAIAAATALGLSQAIPAVLGQRTWLDLATGSDVVRWGRFTGRPQRSIQAFQHGYWPGAPKF